MFLDVGCDEALLKTLLAPDIKYTGIDVAGKPDIVLNLEKIERLPFDDSTFDCVICSDVLEHLDKLPFYVFRADSGVKGDMLLCPGQTPGPGRECQYGEVKGRLSITVFRLKTPPTAISGSLTSRRPNISFAATSPRTMP